MKGSNKKKSLFVILAVTALTLYNILPTIFFYSKNLNAPISKNQATSISCDISKRVNKLEDSSIKWIKSYCKLLQIKPSKIQIAPKNNGKINVLFSSEKEARSFRIAMKKAGLLIPFFPKRMAPYDLNFAQNDSHIDQNQNLVQLKREIPIHFDVNNLSKYFSFAEMETEDGNLTTDYRKILDERVLEIITKVTHESTIAENVEKTLYEMSPQHKILYFMVCAEKIIEYQNAFSKNSSLEKTFLSNSFTSSSHSKESLYNHCLEGIRLSLDIILKDKINLKETLKKQNIDENDFNIEQAATLKNISEKEKTLLKAISVLKNKKSIFLLKSEQSEKQDYSIVLQNHRLNNAQTLTLSTGSKNPVISSISVDYKDRKVNFTINERLIKYSDNSSESLQRRCQQIVFDEIARLKDTTAENIEKSSNLFSINLSTTANATNYLSLDLTPIASSVVNSLKSSISQNWKRTSQELSSKNYPIVSWDEFKNKQSHEKRFNLVVFSPALHEQKAPRGFSNSSIYIIGKDMLYLLNKAKDSESKGLSDELFSDFKSLQAILSINNAQTISGNSYPFTEEFANDLIFEIKDFYGSTLAATREKWTTFATSKNATLEFSNRKERIITTNRIEDSEHVDLLKWQDDFNKSYQNTRSEGYLSVPKPTKSPFLSNISLSFFKYFRGDSRKILHWGLDLNGGTTVKLALKDKQNTKVTSDAEIHQGINELYRRVNKLGVSDVSIRKEGSFITLDFPSTQSVSAEELISSSSMTLHIVNEKFSLYNLSISDSVARFLQEVWNEALVTNQKDLQSVNKIAFSHLYGDANDINNPSPRSAAASILLQNGLELANPENSKMTNNFNDKVSMIGVLDGSSYQDWYGQTNPLVILFHNYALAGAALSSVQAGYEPSTGNYLHFSVKNSLLDEGKQISPRDNFYQWTSVFSTAEIASTKYGAITSGRGWRLAPVLNGRILSMPTLGDALRDGGRISGSFTQKEIRSLTADLKAGSLTYTPEIISETTISPELGIKERYQGIFATIVAFIAVLVIMIGYYRFAGVIASIAVIFNILIIWGTLQNLGASLTLAGIAGIILTIGMAVDANVLIFERIKEEQLIQKNVVQAIRNGYSKAFTAIFDSNITTIIAALILLNFDSGPVKGFALTLIIGIVSSMFTALYMTKTFFSFWVKSGSSQKLSMMDLIPNTGFSFLKYGKAVILGAVVVVSIGATCLYSERNSILGMDFTGGMTVQLEVEKKKGEMSSKHLVENALTANGFNSSEIQVRELNTPNHLKIFLSNSLNNPNRPFANLKRDMANIDFAYQKNSKLNFLVSTLSNSGVKLTEESLHNLEKNFTNISGQMSDTMRNNAIFGLILALGAILIYLTFRFEFAYALSATIGLGFDLLLTVAILAIGKFFNMPLSIDLTTIGALMTIIGYSLNDTIIVFDRIRSDSKINKKTSYTEIINNAINKTLSRTIMTSLTTLVVLLSLVMLGGKSIFGFSFLMTIGVIIGTISTLFVSSTFLLLFKKKGSTNKFKVSQITTIA